jgi:hypothetical protein
MRAVAGRRFDDLDGTRRRLLGERRRPGGCRTHCDHGGRQAERPGTGRDRRKIAFVGDAASARKRLRPGGRLIALEREQTVIPGLVDAHVHMLDAGLMRQRLPLDEAKTKDDALEIITEYSKKHPELKWVIGSGWSVSLFLKEDQDVRRWRGGLQG